MGGQGEPIGGVEVIHRLATKAPSHTPGQAPAEEEQGAPGRGQTGARSPVAFFSGGRASNNPSRAVTT